MRQSLTRFLAFPRQADRSVLFTRRNDMNMGEIVELKPESDTSALALFPLRFRQLDSGRCSAEIPLICPSFLRSTSDWASAMFVWGCDPLWPSGRAAQSAEQLMNRSWLPYRRLSPGRHAPGGVRRLAAPARPQRGRLGPHPPPGVAVQHRFTGRYPAAITYTNRGWGDFNTHKWGKLGCPLTIRLLRPPPRR